MRQNAGANIHHRCPQKQPGHVVDPASGVKKAFNSQVEEYWGNYTPEIAKPYWGAREILEYVVEHHQGRSDQFQVEAIQNTFSAISQGDSPLDL